MIYEIMNRSDASRATGETEAPATAIVSITDTGSEKNTFYPAQWLKAVLELQFDDVEAACSFEAQIQQYGLNSVNF